MTATTPSVYVLLSQDHRVTEDVGEGCCELVWGPPARRLRILPLKLVDDRAFRLHLIFIPSERRTAQRGDAHSITRFEEVVELLNTLDLDRLWQAATDLERRTLIEELLDSLEVLPDHLVVGVHGAPKLNVALAEVGLGNGRDSVNVGVEGTT